MDSEKYEYRLTYQVYPQLGGIVAEYVVKNGQDEILRLQPQNLWNSGILQTLSAKSDGTVLKRSRERSRGPVPLIDPSLDLFGHIHF